MPSWITIQGVHVRVVYRKLGNMMARTELIKTCHDRNVHLLTLSFEHFFNHSFPVHSYVYQLPE